MAPSRATLYVLAKITCACMTRSMCFAGAGAMALNLLKYFHVKSKKIGTLDIRGARRGWLIIYD